MLAARNHWFRPRFSITRDVETSETTRHSGFQPGGSEPRLISKATKKARPPKAVKCGWRPCGVHPAIAAGSAKVWMVPRVARRAAGNVMSLARTRARMSCFFAPGTTNRLPARLKRRIGERDTRLDARCHQASRLSSALVQETAKGCDCPRQAKASASAPSSTIGSGVMSRRLLQVQAVCRGVAMGGVPSLNNS